jgi:hypothetical protein
MGVVNNHPWVVTTLLVPVYFHSDRPKTLSAKYSAETDIRQVLPKTKKVLFRNFLFSRHFFQESTLLVDIVNVLFILCFCCP